MKFLPPKGKYPLRPSDLTVLRPTWNRCCAEPRKVYFKKNAKWNKNKSHVKSSSNPTAICMIFFFQTLKLLSKRDHFDVRRRRNAISQLSVVFWTYAAHTAHLMTRSARPKSKRNRRCFEPVCLGGPFEIYRVIFAKFNKKEYSV